MGENVTPPHHRDQLEVELNRSRDAAVQLLEGLAQKLGAARVRAQTGLDHTRHYIQTWTFRDVAVGIGGIAGRPEVRAFAAGTVIGYLVTRALRS